VDALRQKVLADYKPQYDAVLQQANAKLTRDLGSGFKSEGIFTSANVQKIVLLKDDIEIIAQATGTLLVVYTP
jgi:hypothetical protein